MPFVRAVKVNGNKTFIHGLNHKIPSKSEHLYAADSGIVTRFLLPVLAHGSGSYFLDVKMMSKRPISDMISSLRSLGVKITHGCKQFPLHIHGSKIKITKSHVDISGKLTSQFISGLMLSAPLYSNGLKILFQIERNSFQTLH